MTLWMRGLLAAVMLFCAAGAVRANGEIMIMNAYVQPPLVAGRTPGVLYMTLMNQGAAGDRLISLKSPIADAVELHESSEENGIAKMRVVEALDLPPGATVEFKPGGYHVMLMGLRGPLSKGQEIAFTLTFEVAGEVQMQAIVGEGAAIHEHSEMPAQ